jgi:S-adenosylmethionine:tRNA ribosyltransferase-isomerase
MQAKNLNAPENSQDNPSRPWTLADFHYDLPPALIAQKPLVERSASRLLALQRGSQDFYHKKIKDLPNLLQPGDLLVFNDTKVLAARFFLKRQSGAVHEMLVERPLPDPKQFLAKVRRSKTLKINEVLSLANQPDVKLILLAKSEDGLLTLAFDWPTAPQATLVDLCARYGVMPLPSYIEREVEAEDQERYQSVFAKNPGAVAAPTASLHFDAELLAQLSASGIHQAFVTLHVGAGTFTPVRVADIQQHTMHAERFYLPLETKTLIEKTKKQGGRVIAIGTTVLRTLEGAYQQGFQAGASETDLFIYPGFSFQVVDALVTNFHLPQSTLLMLVAAFAGYETTMAAYQAAIAEHYRFYSYGDAMLILPELQVPQSL